MPRPDARPGRGAPDNRTPTRFNLPERQADGDWLDAREEQDGGPPPLRTTVTVEHPKTIIAYNKSPDIGFDRSVNAYRGCEHGCIYCFARPTHAFHDLSPGLDFETKLFAKPNAAALLRETLARPKYRPKPIAMGTNTDPYQPIEGRYRITRALLELCLETRHPVTITTKSDRVLRDLDLLAELARHRLVAVAVSVTTLDPRLSGLLEPRASAPAKRLAALGRLVEAGVPAHCSVAPVIPAITDEFIEAILARASALGGLDSAAPALRGRAAVPRVARGALSRAWRQGHGNRPFDPRRARQRSPVLQPDETERGVGRTVAQPL